MLPWTQNCYKTTTTTKSAANKSTASAASTVGFPERDQIYDSWIGSVACYPLHYRRSLSYFKQIHQYRKFQDIFARRNITFLPFRVLFIIQSFITSGLIFFFIRKYSLYTLKNLKPRICRKDKFEYMYIFKLTNTCINNNCSILRCSQILIIRKPVLTHCKFSLHTCAVFSWFLL